jgi:hypothetical protein
MEGTFYDITTARRGPRFLTRSEVRARVMVVVRRWLGLNRALSEALPPGPFVDAALGDPLRMRKYTGGVVPWVAEEIGEAWFFAASDALRQREAR